MRLSYCHLFILALLFISIHSNVNYVVNGQFSQPNISNTQFTQQSSGIINGWFGSVIETGLGSAYNAYW